MSETIENIPAPTATDEQDDCYRCGYVLRGIDDDQPCPECGLLARRSRRLTDDLHHTRPRWLRRITIGVVLLLLAVVLVCTLPISGPALADAAALRVTARRWRWLVAILPLAPMNLAILLLLVGTWLFTSREGYAPADAADQRRRASLRMLAGFIAAGFVAINFEWSTNARGVVLHSAVRTLLATANLISAIAMLPFPLLLFTQLRSLAKRVRSAHLAEHCVIVGTGLVATLLGTLLMSVLANYGESLGLRHDWMNRSSVGMALFTMLIVSFALFGIWSVYLLARFGFAFRRASRALRREWRSDDRSIAPADAAT
jgi:hypothetical protein